MRIAIVHHWFVTLGGGERVAEILAEMFPNADIFTLVADDAQVPIGLHGRTLTTSFLQRIPGATKKHRYFLPLYPFAVEQLDLTSYDLVLTSDSGPMKGVITNPNAVHICYCHSPMRYLWDGYYEYAASMPSLAKLPFMLAAHYVRNWDYIAAQRVTHFLANSNYVAGRIQHYYGRTSTVIHPPVDTQLGFIADAPQDYYLAAGRLVAYKKTEILIHACNHLGRRLRIVGTGPELNRLHSIAGPTIEFLGQVNAKDLWQNYAHCRALLFAADEDFGIVPLEAQACGRPVIAFEKGGALETVIGMAKNQPKGIATGVFYPQQLSRSVEEAIQEFERRETCFSPLSIQQHASRFDTTLFTKNITNFIASVIPNITMSMSSPQ